MVITNNPKQFNLYKTTQKHNNGQIVSFLNKTTMIHLDINLHTSKLANDDLPVVFT